MNSTTLRLTRYKENKLNDGNTYISIEKKRNSEQIVKDRWDLAEGLFDFFNLIPFSGRVFLFCINFIRLKILVVSLPCSFFLLSISNLGSINYKRTIYVCRTDYVVKLSLFRIGTTKTFFFFFPLIYINSKEFNFICQFVAATMHKKISY